jgi:adenylate cyclase
MTMSRRNRREWRIILWISLTSAVISAYFGYAVAPADQPPLWGAVQGILTSLLIATPVAFFEVRRARINSLGWMRRLPLAGYFLVKVVFYCVVILVGLILSRLLMSIGDRQFIIFDPIFRNSVLFSVSMSVVGNLIIETGRLLGFGTLKNLLLGRYARPRSEQRAFLLIDMKDSTGLAEKLGAIRFHELLNAFFRDIADAALECDAEIHKYVGDEAILTWPEGLALSAGDCLDCPFLTRQNIDRNAARYRDRFGTVPEFSRGPSFRRDRRRRNRRRAPGDRLCRRHAERGGAAARSLQELRPRRPRIRRFARTGPTPGRPSGGGAADPVDPWPRRAARDRRALAARRPGSALRLAGRLQQGEQAAEDALR